MQDELDQSLQTLFEEHAQNLPEEPFVGRTLKLVKRQRFRQLLKESLPWALGVLCCALLSPFLIRGSILLSGGLDRLFTATGNYLATPLGMLIAGLCTLTILLFNRKLVF